MSGHLDSLELAYHSVKGYVPSNIKNYHPSLVNFNVQNQVFSTPKILNFASCNIAVRTVLFPKCIF